MKLKHGKHHSFQLVLPEQRYCLGMFIFLLKRVEQFFSRNETGNEEGRVEEIEPQEQIVTLMLFKTMLKLILTPTMKV